MDKPLILAITACPVGVAHTYIAEKSLIEAGEKLGYAVRVETHGSIGAEHVFTDEEIAQAIGVIVASDKAIDNLGRFDGMPLISTNITRGINHPEELIKTVAEGKAEAYHATPQGRAAAKSSYKKARQAVQGGSAYKDLMNGVSHMIPFVICGGILIALPLAFGKATSHGLAVSSVFGNTILQIGSIGFMLMIPILAGYIAYSIADRPALAPAMIGALVANNGKFFGGFNAATTTPGTGFLGAIIVGFMAGYLVKYLKKIRLPQALQPIMPIFVIPIIGTLTVSLLFAYILGAPISHMIVSLNSGLNYLKAHNLLVLLAAVLGAMMAFDMGGPINKVAFLFGVASIAEGNLEIMGIIGAAGAVPPLGMGLASFLRRNRYTKVEKEAGAAALIMGCIGITEGAIPFAVKDPLRVIPSIMTGTAVSCVIAAAAGVTDRVPHTGPIVAVLGAVGHVGMFFVAIITGSIVTALLVNFLKKKVPSEEA